VSRPGNNGAVGPVQRGMPGTTRRFLAVVAAAAALVLLAACGDDDAGGPGGSAPSTTVPSTEPPTAAQAVLRLEVSGGFTTVERAFSTLPWLTVLDDGTAITPAPVAAIYPGPLLLPVTARTLDPDGLAALFERVRASGLVDGAVDFGQPGIVDAPTTTLTVDGDGITTTLAAAALGEAVDDPLLTPEQRDARARFAALVEALGDLEALAGPGHLGPEEPYVPDALWLRTLPAHDVPEGPTPPGGEPEPTVVVWPVPTIDLAAFEQATRLEGAEAEAVRAVLVEADELTRFEQDGAVFQVLARVALPGDPTPGG